MAKPQLFVIASDLHYPEVHSPTWSAFLSFLKQNRPDGFVFLGDQFDNHSISTYTAGKPGQQVKDSFVEEERGFKRDVLDPLDKLLGSKCEKVYILGNHDDRTNDLNDLFPQLRGCFDRPKNLRLKERGWNVYNLGEIYKHGKLHYVHGESLGGQYHARKALDLFCRSIVYGHLHSPQSFTKILPQDETQKWTSQCLPILGRTNPDYLQGKPNAWTNGWGVVEYHPNGNFNLYSVICSKGVAAYGGRFYRG